MIAAILGGGPSLVEQLRQVPPCAHLYGINHHASQLVDCDFIVFNDERTWDLVKHFPGKKISRWRNKSDIYWDSPQGQISGVCALRYCLTKDYTAILLAGFDCYQKDEYFHTPGVPTGASGAKKTLKEQLAQWSPRDLRIHALGGPLTEIYNLPPDQFEPEFQTLEIVKAQTVHLDKDRHVNFVPGIQKLNFELAKAAISAGITKETVNGC